MYKNNVNMFQVRFYDYNKKSKNEIGNEYSNTGRSESFLNYIKKYNTQNSK